MVQNYLILCGPEGAARYASALAARSGSDLGLVSTAIEPSQVKHTGCRIEEDRQYGDRVLSTFDEPLAVGPAVAQLAGHADAVVIDRLDDWADRLVRFHGSNNLAIDAEITSMLSVMKAQLMDLVLVSRPAEAAPGGAAEMTRKLLKELDPFFQVVVDVRGGQPKVTRGQLPA